MTEIKILDKTIFNRIAAGEVVERPASIVKELVENAIDAGATTISIAVKGGGVDFIRVADNGKGIDSNDIKTAFLPHATSKIHSIDDLDGIATLGFRGEALPSIAAVARVTMISRQENDALGCRYCIDNGTEIDFGEMGAPTGTSVTVENLFERIPARKKFLSKNSIEENVITNLVERFILSHSDIAFTYTLNDKNIYLSNGNGVENAIKTIYGNEYFANMLKIDSNMSGIRLSGYINKPSFTKHSKAFQTLIINGRYVVNEEISYTIYGCYQKYLMKRQYPTYVLYLDVPYDLVDVNVHPSKMQVRFAIPGMIKKLVSDTIKEQALPSASIPKDIYYDDIFTASEHKDNRTPAPHLKTIEENGFTVYTPITEESLTPLKQNDIENTSSDVDTLDIMPLFETAHVDSSVLGETRKPDAIQDTLDNRVERFRESTQAENASTLSSQKRFNIEPTTKIIGKLFNTYIIIEAENDIYLIDQHAAHERILYDRYLAEYKNGGVAVQNMLIPYEFTVSAAEAELISDRLSALASVGFNIYKHKKPNTFLLKTVPLCCVGLNARSFINDFLSDDFTGTKRLLPESFTEKLMQHACKSAIKGKDDLSEIEIKSLLHQIRTEVNELFCPHGRPIAIKISRSEIEKWFKRLV